MYTLEQVHHAADMGALVGSLLTLATVGLVYLMWRYK